MSFARFSRRRDFSSLSSFSSPDGCELHGVSPEQIVTWWREAARRTADVGLCSCCAGPSPPRELTCKSCRPLTPELQAELEAVSPCVICGERGYTRDEHGWLCEPCWRAA